MKAGGAYLPGLSDIVVLVRGKSKIFLAGPPLVKVGQSKRSLPLDRLRRGEQAPNTGKVALPRIGTACGPNKIPLELKRGSCR